MDSEVETQADATEVRMSLTDLEALTARVDRMKSPPMPAVVAKAIVGVMAEVKKLGKEGENTFQRYKFTSVDQFYEALGPLMAAHKLFTMAIEKSTTVEMREAANDRGDVKKSAWLMAEFDFWLYHESGEAYGPVTRHIQVAASGAQSYASAQSYAEKYFLRNLFKVPTGDVDEVDESQQRGLPPQAREQPVRGKQTVTSGRPAKESEAKRPTLEPDASAMSLAAMLASLATCDTRQAIAGWSTKHGDEKERLLPEDREKLKEAFVAKQADIKKPKPVSALEDDGQRAEAAAMAEAA